MKLGYNANPFSNLVTSRVLDHADGLLAVLTMRARCQDRHLIFVAHSLGGIVVKRTLITATVRNAYKAIFYSTIAVVFLGTPHHGSQLAGWAGIASRFVAWATLRHQTTNLTRESEPFSDTLRDVTSSFSNIASKFAIRSSRETMPTRLPPEGDQSVSLARSRCPCMRSP